MCDDRNEIISPFTGSPFVLNYMYSLAMKVGSRSRAISAGLALNNANNSFEDARSKSSRLLINASTNLLLVHLSEPIPRWSIPINRHQFIQILGKTSLCR